MEGCCGSTVKYLVFLSNLLVFVSSARIRKFEVILIAFFEGKNSKIEIWYCPYTLLVEEEKIKNILKCFCRVLCIQVFDVISPLSPCSWLALSPWASASTPLPQTTATTGSWAKQLVSFPPDPHLSSYPGWPYRESRPGPGIRIRRQQDSRSGPGEEEDFFRLKKGDFVCHHRP